MKLVFRVIPESQIPGQVKVKENGKSKPATRSLKKEIPTLSEACISGESNPGRIDGNDSSYHWTTDADYIGQSI